MIATARPCSVLISRTRRARSMWSAAVPCEKLRRTTSTPARISRASVAGSLHAGPSVATIFVLRGKGEPRFTMRNRQCYAKSPQAVWRLPMAFGAVARWRSPG